MFKNKRSLKSLGQVDVEEPCTITLTRKFKTSKPCFEMIGSTAWKTKIPGLNMPEILGSRSKIATWFWWQLISRRDAVTNESKFIPKNPQEAQKVTKAYKELKGVCLIKRVRRGVYLINPKSYIPSGDNFPVVEEVWEKIL